MLIDNHLFIEQPCAWIWNNIRGKTLWFYYKWDIFREYINGFYNIFKYVGDVLQNGDKWLLENNREKRGENTTPMRYQLHCCALYKQYFDPNLNMWILWCSLHKISVIILHYNIIHEVWIAIGAPSQRRIHHKYCCPELHNFILLLFGIWTYHQEFDPTTIDEHKHLK